MKQTLAMPTNPQQTPSRAKAIFDQLAASEDQDALIKRWLVDPRPDDPDNEVLEFMRGDSADDEDVKRNWSKALSAFANTDGGLVLWGISAPQSGPRQAKPVDDPAGLRQRLEQFLPGATEPPVQGVAFLHVEDPKHRPRGYLICHVPSSPWKPHEATHSGKHYYVRAGDRSVPAPRELLRRMFHPGNECRLTITSQLHEGTVRMSGPGGGIRNIAITIWMHNRGETTAHDVLLVLRLATAGLPLPQLTSQFWQTAHSSLGKPAGLAARPIHPGETVPVTTLNVGQVDGSGVCQFPADSCQFQIQIFSRDHRHTSLFLKVPCSRAEIGHQFEAQQLG